MARVLVIDDEPSICWGLARLGKNLGHEVLTASSAEQGLQQAGTAPPDLIVLDVRLPGIDGLTAIKQFRELLGSVPILIMTAYGDLETAVAAVRQGAFEYLIKPFDLDFVQRAWIRALESRAAAEPSPRHKPPRSGLLGRSAVMQEVFKRIALASASQAGVLLLGESGVGKELVARAVHEHSDRAQGPFIAVNIASLSPTLVESELFGHRRGAFTGADQERTGLLALADGGTLFLDEVADIPPPVQVKLLRVLEQGEVTPVGSGKGIPTNFRIISATHRDLAERMADGGFRHDLYYRLGAFRIEIPPLRERGDDVELLAEHFLAAGAPVGKSAVDRFSPRAIAELRRRPWYGNVRELRHAVEHALVVARGGLIEPEHFPASVSQRFCDETSRAEMADDALRDLVRRWANAKLSEEVASGDLYRQLMQLVEPPFLAAALEKNKGQCAAAARQVGLHRITLRKKLDEHGLADASG